MVMVGNALDDGSLGIELRALLVEVRHLQPCPAAHGSLVWLDLADEQP